MRLVKTMMAVMAVTCMAWVSQVTVAQAAPESFTVDLSGAQQVPAVKTNGTGVAHLTYNPANRELTWSLAYKDMSSPVTMAHIHGPAPAGKNAGVQVWLTKKGQPVSSPIVGKAKLTVPQAKDLMADQLYLNVHTKDHPPGEMRGQIIPPQG